VGAAALVSWAPVRDPDLWWHLATGERRWRRAPGTVDEIDDLEIGIDQRRNKIESVRLSRQRI
jgi:hypothetical protein